MEPQENNGVTVEVNVKVPAANGEPETVLSFSGKLTKADATLWDKEQIYIYIQPGAGGDYRQASLNINYQGSTSGLSLKN